MKFAVHPGLVTSQTDGQTHLISLHQLVQLYRLRPGEYIFWDDASGMRGFRWEDYLHLFPSPTGRYGRPEEP